jgi:arylsulfatase A-like enzyme
VSWKDDLRRAARLALGGALAYAVVEPIVTVVLAQGEVRIPTFLRFLALDLTVAGLLWLLLTGLLALIMLAARGLGRLRGKMAGPGLLAGGPAPARDFVGKVPWVWAGLLVAAGYIVGSAAFTILFLKHFKEPQLIAGSLALIQLGLVGCGVLVVYLLGLALRRAGRRLAGRLGAWNPLGRALPALAVMVLLAIPASALIVKKLPQLRGVAPWRELLAFIVIVAGIALASRRHGDRPIFSRDGKRRWRIIGAAFAVLAILTLTKLGADDETKYLAVSASPPTSRLVALLRTLNDFDRDGFGSLLGENDCAPFDAKINPLAYDIPSNGIDENCNGHDGPLRHDVDPGQTAEVPKELDRPWNVLLVTIDTVRYDHTTMGGYIDKTGRNTTPNLMALANRATSFGFAQAPSAGTMASMPAILTSRFFHSGIHLGPAPGPHMPPKLTEDNVLISEIMKKAGYVTGAITTHEYFIDWGMNQGFDTYDNELGAKPDPYGIKADKTTDKAQAWIAKHNSHKWFLWVHFIDPHGRYVAHPGQTQYGASEEDLYDGEIAWTDKNLGRLFDFVRRLPGADHTIIVVTSDHGDGFMEHGFINHGAALNREILNIPLIFYVPDNEPQRLGGIVSNLDIFPTLAQLAHQDVSQLHLEGRSLVPEIFYGRQDKDRVVFAETNYPVPQRAAVSNHYKLIYNLKNNVYELFDLTTDPWEHKNVWGRDTKGSQQMKGALDDWLDRVYYSRDESNQAQTFRDTILLDQRPTPAHPISDLTIDGGSLAVLGWDSKPASGQPGGALAVTVYFETKVVPPHDLRFELSLEQPAQAAASPGAPAVPARQLARLEKVPLDGAFRTSRWKVGDLVKLEYQFKLPANLAVDKGVQVWLRALDARRTPVPLVGSGVDPSGNRASLGDLSVATPPPAAPVAPAP